MLIIGIMQGFHKATTAALQGIHCDIIMQAPAGGFLNAEKIKEVLKKEFSEQIAYVVPFAYEHVIVQNNDETDISHVMILQGLEITALPPSHRMMRMIAWYEPHSLLPVGTLVISKVLAQRLSIAHKDRLTLLSASMQKKKGVTSHELQFDRNEVDVIGVFKSGIEEFDERMLFCSLETFSLLFPESGISQIGIMVKSNQSIHHVQSLLKQRFNFSVLRWQDFYPSLFDALALENYAMILIFCLVLLIVSITLSSLLMMYLFYQQRTIFICRAMGMSVRMLRTIFMLINGTISLISTIIGSSIALVVCWMLNYYQLISLPEVYYIHYLPAELSLFTVIIIGAFINGAGFFTSWLVTARIKTGDIAQTLKQYG